VTDFWTKAAIVGACGITAGAFAQSSLNLVIDDLAPLELGQHHEAVAAGWECARACACPPPYPCAGPCPEVCVPPCLRPLSGVFTRAELTRAGDFIGDAVLEAGFAVPGATAGAVLRIGNPGGQGRSQAVLRMIDPGGDEIVVEASGVWVAGGPTNYFDGEILSVNFVDVEPLDGNFDGSVPGTVALYPIGCGVQGHIQYSYTVSATACSRGSVLVQASGTPGSCAADFNCSGTVDGDDVVAFFGRWDLGLADINGDTLTDGDDVMAFFERWDAGC